MKKFAAIIAASGLALAACSSDSEPETEPVEETDGAADTMTDTQDAEETESDEEGGGVSVDEGLFNVEVTIPSSFFEGEDPEQVAANVDNAEEAIVNEDGSITYKMSKAQHEEMMEEVATSVEEATATITESGDYPSIQAIETSDNYDHFIVQVDREAYENSFDGFATMTLGVVGSLYQLFNGEDPDSYEVTIEMEDVESGEVFNTITYPEALEEMGEE
ncbi:MULTISPECIES: hypothetical protein [unclassified Planococcus (in: firmicutes)]|uniref:hypothetical protein n=1 Tax=unclassified Planococcus (in: firmicutes) TaxID=2662419 RepID=UPI000C335BD3|nr:MULTISPECIES: hypothetical protein [unclassified Planococcus (in: firmicutes)]AUD13073.1 hypothetical protein CW734_04495 [Planococcus sp. MB-3u-03]PKG45443.1 hypothetical protein CXF66_12555 [Planococcus sp. Urea-trap-24]PKG88961.1 hypothetical protein CXF91_08980 [Planococcus sp. Urea-3u-39]PKH36329.1 hypothetical protein CXF77_14650 [Planococcus sp. MB-3u-09]